MAQLSVITGYQALYMHTLQPSQLTFSKNANSHSPPFRSIWHYIYSHMLECLFPKRRSNQKSTTRGFTRLIDTNEQLVRLDTTDKSNKMLTLLTSPEKVLHAPPTTFSSGTRHLQPYLERVMNNFLVEECYFEIGKEKLPAFEEVLRYGFLTNDGSNKRISTLYLSLTPALVNL